MEGFCCSDHARTRDQLVCVYGAVRWDRSGEDYRTISAERRFLKALRPPTGDEVELRQLGQEQDWAAGCHDPHHAGVSEGEL